MTPIRFFACTFAPPALWGLIASALLAPVACAATPSPDANRVTQAIDVDKRVALTERRAGWITQANDEGPVSDDLAMTHLALILKRSPERQRAFEQFLRDQNDPASPDYQHWLSPAEVGERFGATAHDLDAIADWLRSQGLGVDEISNSRTRIRFGGSAAAVSAAFATNLRYYRAGDAKRIANETDAQIPAALADAISSVAGLQTVRYRSALRMATPRPGSIDPVEIHPAGSNCSGSTCSYSVFPADFARIYNLDPVYAAGYKGSGQTIAVVGRSRVYAQDISRFQQLTGLPSGTPTVIVPPAGIDPGDPLTTCSDNSDPNCGNPSDQLFEQSEATLDVQRALGVAPEATIDLIVSANAGSNDGVNTAMDYAVDHDPVPAKILSISYTSCEADNGRAVAESLDDFFSQASAEGISVFVASGDAGVAGCASLNATPQADEPKTTNVICSSQYVTCVGGTQFADEENPDTYWSRTNSTYFLSALGYIPEGAWNEPLDSDGHPQLDATGGGVSAYIPTPSWQTGTGVPGSAGRYTPDVSLYSGTREGYFTCVAAHGGSCVVTGGSFTFISIGGTSASAPSFAGITALLNDKTGTAHGNINPRLYALAGIPGAAAFHDVTVASSGVTGCSLAIPSMCNNSTPGPNGLTGGVAGYLVGPGYDEATGLGSVNADNLITHWNDSNTSVNLDQVGLTGSWYNPATSGQGVVMEVVPDLNGAGQGLLFGGWFTFDVSAAGGQRWYSVQGSVSASSASATMPIYISEGGNFAAPPRVGVASIGEATFSFSDCSHGTLSYTFSDGSGRSGSIPLTRLGANSACSTDGSGAVPPSFLLSGAWYDPATSGQGFVFDINTAAHSLFLAWYTYAVNGQTIGGPASQRWYSIQATFTPGVSAYDGIPIFGTSGGVFNNATPVTTGQIGTASLHFQSCTAATLSYDFTSGANAGQHGTISLSRATPAVDGCTL
jgi:pseudomonalisin